MKTTTFKALAIGSGIITISFFTIGTLLKRDDIMLLGCVSILLILAVYVLDLIAKEY
jgi:hypothetical protein